jgi:alkylation response protein AidB-like acyl-CoA dehydrogenase
MQSPTLDERLAGVLAAASEHAASVDAEGRYPVEAVGELRRSGLMGLTLASETGGLGGSPRDFVEAVSRIAAACGSTAMVYLMHVSALMPIAAAPPSGQPDLVREVASGTKLGTLAFSERGSRSHFWAPVSRQAGSDGSISVKTNKSWVTSADHADILVCSTLTAAGGRTDSDLFAVPRGTAGISAGGEWRGMGMRGNDSRPLDIDVSIPATWRLGAPGDGFRLMTESVLPWFNLGNAAVSLGLAGAAVDSAVAHCTGSRFDHLGETLADLATIRAQLARMHIRVDVTRTYLHAVAESLAHADATVPLRVLACKAWANDAALEITDSAMRVCGGAAFSQQLAVDRFFRDARAGHVMAPTADVLYELYGRAITGKPLF